MNQNDVKKNDPLYSISPIDGRYREKTKDLRPYFSEAGLIRYRILVEIRYLVYFLLYLQNPSIKKNIQTNAEKKFIERIRILSIDEKSIFSYFDNLGNNDIEIVKQIETKGFEEIPATNHDVKAVEYFIKHKLEENFSHNPQRLSEYKELVHFALTSEDVNNLAYSLLIRNSINNVLLVNYKEILQILHNMAASYASLPMMSRTHGQAASPTTFGKEILIFIHRMEQELADLKNLKLNVKLNGATGNYNAHLAALPSIDWDQFSRDFIKYLETDADKEQVKIQFNPVTPQIEPHDSICKLFHILFRLNTILTDFCQDMWRYISDAWIRQKPKKGEVGSSTMPHKINPIDFENAEGNFQMANALLHFFTAKLPVSRLQRDLSDSTIQRNIGVAVSHILIALKSLQKGLNKIDVNEQIILAELKNQPILITEAIQTILRREGVANPYELLKKLSRGKEINLTAIQDFIRELPVTEETKNSLLKLKPENYLGLAEKIVKKYLSSIK